MHRLILHFQRIAPTWLLLDLDWASTRQATPFMSSCIVAIGHVKWIEGSKHTSKDKGFYDPALRGSRPPPSPQIISLRQQRSPSGSWLSSLLYQ
jgi:hypothetical protein